MIHFTVYGSSCSASSTFLHLSSFPPSLRVHRYNNRFYVFATAAARDAFVAEPMFHVRGVAVAARHSPELIHLLRIQVTHPD
jgi:hypothetical protein